MFLLFAGHPAIAAERSQIDSLNALTEAGQPDTIRVHALLSLASLHGAAQPDTIIDICLVAIALIDELEPDADAATARRLRDLRQTALSNMGFVYYRRGLYARAVRTWFEVLAYREAAGDTAGMAILYNNIANAYADLEDLENARRYWEYAMDSYRQIGDSVGIARSWNNFGYVSRLSGDDAAALQYYRRGLEIRRRLGDRRGLGVGLNNIGYVHRMAERYDSARVYYEDAARVWESLGEKVAIATVYSNLGGLYLDMQQPQKALVWLRRTEALGLEAEDLSLTRDVALHYSNYYAATGKHRKALARYRDYIAMRDSLSDLDARAAAAQSRIQYEYEKKEALSEEAHKQEIAAEEGRRARQQLILLIVVLAFLLAVVVAVLLVQRIRLINRQKRIIERQARDIEMEALRAKMNPHFIFNSLNSIKHLVIKSQTRAAVDYMNKFARLVRLILENSERKLIPLGDELEAMAHYLALEAMRFDKKFSFDIDDQLQDKLIEVPPLLLQPYVENAIWHGLMPLDGQGRIVIRTYAQAGRYWIEVEDNGIGRQAAEAAKTANSVHTGKKQSMGMSLSGDRLRLLDMIHGYATELEVLDRYDKARRPSGTLVRISIATPENAALPQRSKA